MPLAKAEQVRIALNFERDVLPALTEIIEQDALLALRNGDAKDARLKVKSLEVMKTALRRFTTPQDLS
jgi:hypothetical protein